MKHAPRERRSRAQHTRALRRIGAPLPHLEVPCLAKEEDEREHERDTQESERGLAKGALESPLKTRPIKRGGVRRIEKDLVGSDLRVARTVAAPHHTRMIRVSMNECTMNAAAVRSAPAKVPKGYGYAAFVQ